MTLTSAEQYLLELINRARLNPSAEAARLGIDLNAGLVPGTLKGTARQPLAPNALLESAATDHSTWMLSTDVFSHTGAGGSTPSGRAAAKGYGGWMVGENISWRGTSAPSIDLDGAIQGHHDGLFRSAGHRTNLLHDGFREVGLGQVAGEFTASGSVWRASMLTELFGTSGSSHFVTGAVYDDIDRNGFYGIGEGRGGAVLGVGTTSATTAAAGGYAVAATPGADVLVTGHVGIVAFSVSVDLSKGSVKLDVVDEDLLASSGNIRLLTGIDDARLLGVAQLSAIGNGAANRIDGNAGANRIEGHSGRDVLSGLGGKDTLLGGTGRDALRGGAGNDMLDGGDESDNLLGGAGQDWLAGGRGADKLTGGTGADHFAFHVGDGRDRVTDFSLSQGDRIKLDDALWGGGLTAAQVVETYAIVTSGSVVLDFGADELSLDGVAGTAGLSAAIEFL